MPDIIFRISNGIGRVPTSVINIAPTRRFINGNKIVVADTVDIPITGDPTVIYLLPSGPTWCWKVSEKSNHLYVRYVIVPDVPGPIEYTDLQSVDPSSLSPTVTPDPAWVAQLDTKLDVPNGAIQPMRMIGFGPVVPADSSGRAGDLYIKT